MRRTAIAVQLALLVVAAPVAVAALVGLGVYAGYKDYRRWRGQAPLRSRTVGDLRANGRIA